MLPDGLELCKALAKQYHRSVGGLSGMLVSGSVPGCFGATCTGPLAPVHVVDRCLQLLQPHNRQRQTMSLQAQHMLTTNSFAARCLRLFFGLVLPLL